MCWCSGGLQGRLEGGGPERLTRPHSHLLRRLSTSSYLARHPLSRWSRKDFFRPSHTRSAVLLQLPNPTPSSPMLAGSLLDATDLVREKSKLTQIKVFRKQPRALDLLLPSSPPTWLSWIPGCPLCKPNWSPAQRVLDAGFKCLLLFLCPCISLQRFRLEIPSSCFFSFFAP